MSALPSLPGPAGWQVVVGPQLPPFAPLAGARRRLSPARLLRHPAVLLAVTTVLAVGPALATDTTGAGTMAVARLGAGLAGAAGLALAARLTGRAGWVARLLPLAFVALQLVAVVRVIGALTGDDAGLGAAGPHLLAAAVTIVTALRGVLGAVRHRPRSPSHAPPPPG